MKTLETTAATIEFEIVEDAHRDSDPRLVDAVMQNEKLRHLIYEARSEIMALRAEIDKLSSPPSTYGVYLRAHDDNTVDILAQGRKLRAQLHPAIKVESLRRGQEPAPGRDPDVFRPRDLHQVFVRRRPGTRWRHHVGARIDPTPAADPPGDRRAVIRTGRYRGPSCMIQRPAS